MPSPQMKHLIIVDPLQNLNLKLDSSIKTAKALCQIGHDAFLTTAEHMCLRTPKLGKPLPCASGNAFRLAEGSQGFSIDQRKEYDLNSFDFIHVRKEPPMDLSYLSMTWVLDHVDQSRTQIINKPQALRDFNEKLIILQYPQYCQPSLYSSQAEVILEFIEKTCDGHGIIKPVELFGGRGIFDVDLGKESPNFWLQRLRVETKFGTEKRFVQPFDKAIYDGEVRVFSAFGETISWCLKKPPAHSYMANTSSGAKLLPYKPSKKMQAMISEVSKDLQTKGINMVGYDVIGEAISEINITSPRLLLADEDSHRESAYYSKIAALFERFAVSR